jgi:putative drug exporter of the RND superfamily
MSPAFHRLGRLAARRPYTVIGTWLAIAALVIAASAGFGRDLEDSFDVPGTDSAQARAALSAAGSERAGLTAQIVVTPRVAGGLRDAPGASAALAELQAGAAGLPNVLDARREISPDGRVGIVRVQYPVIEDLSLADLARLKAFAAEQRAGSPLRIELGGDLFSAFEDSGFGISELIGIAAAIVILLVAFGSVIAMGLPIGMALFGIALGISLMSLVAHLIAIPSFAPQLAAMIGLGVGIDYALLLVTRHREHLAQGLAVEEAAARSVATAGRAVVLAGGTVVIAILGLIVAGIPFLTAAGIAIAVVVLIMVLASITLLPAFLALAGPRIGGRRLGSGARWQRWGDHVSRHALPYAVGGTLVLAALAAPALDLRLGFPDEGTLPTTRTERRAYDLVAQGFGPGINGPLVVVADADEAARVRSAVAADPGIAAVAPPETRGSVAMMLAYPTTAPQDGATVATIERLRATVDAHIGGNTADWADMGDRLADRLPYFLGAVVLLSFVLLTVVFRSVLVPLKAACLNLLSVGAAYGVIVVVFQWGWAADLIGLESTIPILPFIPVFMFAVLFGLSMDYEVFLLSRMREHYVRTGDNRAAVIQGIAGTARVITAAALIMIAVFGGFVFDDDPRVKMFGLGLATAILIDATIVRLVLVPAIMQMLGDANWWLPRWLGRLLPDRGLSAAGRA